MKIVLKSVLIFITLSLFFAFNSLIFASNPVPAGNTETTWSFTSLSDLNKWYWFIEAPVTCPPGFLCIQVIQGAPPNGQLPSNPWSWSTNTFCPNNPYGSSKEGFANVSTVGGWMVQQNVTGNGGQAVSEYITSAYPLTFPSTPTNDGWRMSFYIQWPSLSNHGEGLTLYYDSGRTKKLAQAWADSGAVSSGGTYGLKLVLYDTNGNQVAIKRFDLSTDNGLINGGIVNSLHQFIVVGGNNGTQINFWYQDGSNAWTKAISYSPGSFQAPQNMDIGNSVTQNGCDFWSSMWTGTIAYATYQPGSQITTLTSNGGVTYPAGGNATYSGGITTIYGNTASFNITGFGSSNSVGVNAYGVRSDDMVVCNTLTQWPNCSSVSGVASTGTPYTTPLNFTNTWGGQPGLNTPLLSAYDWDYNHQDATSTWWTNAQYCYDNLGPNAPIVTGSGAPGYVQFTPAIPSDQTSGSIIGGFNYTCASGVPSTNPPYNWQASTDNFSTICASGSSTGTNTVTLDTVSGAGCGITSTSSTLIYMRFQYIDNVNNWGNWGSATATSQPTITYPPTPTITNNVSCLYNSDGRAGDVTISWSTTSPAVSYVDISDNDPTFSSFYNKAVFSTSTTAPDGFGQFGSGAPLALNPGHTYYVRTWNGTYHSTDNGSPPASFQINTTCDSAPIGNFDSATCTNFSGWSCDADNWNANLRVDFYQDGPAGSGSYLTSTTANIYRQDLVNANVCGGTGNHGFSFTPPTSIYDGNSHPIYAYGIDDNGSLNTLLNSSPQTVSCPTSTIQGYKVLMPGNVNTTPASNQTIYLNGGSPISSNPYSYSVVPGTYNVSTTVPSGYSVGYTLCINDTSCHNNPPTPGAALSVTVPAGGYTDLWWHFTPPTPPTPTLTNNTNGTLSDPNQCLLGPDLPTSSDLQITWTDNAAAATWVDISTDNFVTYYHKAVSGTPFQPNSTYAPTGFNGYQGVSGALTLSPNTTYYVRLYNGSTGSSVTFSIPQCTTPAVSCSNPTWYYTGSYTWTPTISGGEGNYTSSHWSYTWTGITGSCTSSTCSQTYSSPTTANITAEATDTQYGIGYPSNTASCSMTIYAPLTGVSCSMATPNPKVGELLTWSSSYTPPYPTGGSGNFYYTWSDLPDGNSCDSRTNPNCPGAVWNITYNTPGARTANVTIHDNVTSQSLTSPSCGSGNIVYPSNIQLKGDIHSNQ